MTSKSSSALETIISQYKSSVNEHEKASTLSLIIDNLDKTYSRYCNTYDFARIISLYETLKLCDSYIKQLKTCEDQYKDLKIIDLAKNVESNAKLNEEIEVLLNKISSNENLEDIYDDTVNSLNYYDYYNQ